MRGDKLHAARRAHTMRARPARAPARPHPGTLKPGPAARATREEESVRVLATARASHCVNALSREVTLIQPIP